MRSSLKSVTFCCFRSSCSISPLSLRCILHPTNVSYLFLVGTLPCVPLLLLIYLLSVFIVQLYESTLLLFLLSPSFPIFFPSCCW
jgi:hypothetical protein